MDKEEYKKNFNEDDAVGWDCIDKAIDKIYGDQEPKHYGTILKFSLGGEDPLDGVSIYNSDKDKGHYHFVSYGMSNLYYDEEQAGGEFSGWGFEFTFRLLATEEDKGDAVWVISFMQNLARYVFDSQKWFEEFHFIPANGPIYLESDTAIEGVVFITDPELGRINTPHGEVQFLQMVGVTQKEIDALFENPASAESLIETLKKDNPLLITDLSRKN